jgi:hypothetical protein
VGVNLLLDQSLAPHVTISRPVACQGVAEHRRPLDHATNAGALDANPACGSITNPVPSTPFRRALLDPRLAG